MNIKMQNKDQITKSLFHFISNWQSDKIKIFSILETFYISYTDQQREN